MLERSSSGVLIASMVGVAACAHGSLNGGQTAQLTSAEMSARYVDAAVEAERTRSHSQALALADHALVASPENPWAHYDRAVALHELRQTERAVQEYRDAEARFGDRAPWGKSVAIYGRARALFDAGRCAEARAAHAEFAAFVRDTDPRGADMAIAYAQSCRQAQSEVGTRASAVATAVVEGDYARALQLADGPSSSAERNAPSPWLDYNRGVALAALGRTEEALQAFASAERRFAGGNVDRRGQSIAIYGRARALDTASRCAEAKPVYEQYAAFVRSDDPEAADDALAVARQCREP